MPERLTDPAKAGDPEEPAETNRLMGIREHELWAEIRPYLFSASTFEVLGRALLDIGFPGNAKRAPLHALQDFVEQTLKLDISKTALPEMYFREVVRQYLGIRSLPLQKVLEIYYDASKDLREIQDNLASYELRLEEIGKSSSGRASYERAFCEEMISRNLDARAELIDFLCGYVEGQALHEASENPFGASPLRVRYAFNWQPRYYSRPLSEVRNKLGRLPIPTLSEMERLWSEDRTEFFVQLDRFITHIDPLKAIDEAINQHHVLGRRSEILKLALRSYGAREWVLFCSIVPLQIEGIFTDYCAELGLSLDTATLGPKVEAIRKHFGTKTFMYFDYYRFRFPLIRNAVAHGAYKWDDAENTAKLLLLDLWDVSQHVVEDPLPTNRLVRHLGRLPNCSFFGLLKLCGYVQADLVVPEFYSHRLITPLCEGLARLNSDEFWNWLEALITRVTPEEAEVLAHCVVLLRCSGLREDRTLSILRTVSARKLPDWEDLLKFIDQLETAERDEKRAQQPARKNRIRSDFTMLLGRPRDEFLALLTGRTNKSGEPFS